MYFQQTDLESESSPTSSQSTSQGNNSGPKRLHVSNIPFRFREADLRNLLGVSKLSTKNQSILLLLIGQTNIS